jgi:hypothetical protein
VLEPLTWMAIFAIAGVLAASAAVVFRDQRRCPTCRDSLMELPKPEERTYEVLACPRCPTAVTLAVGQRARLSWCPSCRQRALDTPCIRQPDADGTVAVEVQERCHLCGHEEVLLIETSAPPRGLVVPFRHTGQRRAGGRR